MICEKIGISLPKNIITEIDSLRGDIPRSKFILRLIEAGFKSREKLKK